FVAVQCLPVPAAMLAHKGSFPISFGKAGARIEREPERSDMGAQRIVRSNGLGHEVGLLRLHPWIDMLAEIAVGPAVECAVLYRSHVVRHEISAELVALVHDGPKRMSLRLERKTIGIAQPAGKHAETTCRPIDFEDVGAIVLCLHAVLGDVAV